jgi:hypothetical protein
VAQRGRDTPRTKDSETLGKPGHATGVLRREMPEVDGGGDGNAALPLHKLTQLRGGGWRGVQGGAVGEFQWAAVRW